MLITVTVNGERKEVPAGLTVSGLLDHLNVRKETAIVEHNLTVLKKRENDEVEIKDGDRLEIVRFVGGG